MAMDMGKIWDNCWKMMVKWWWNDGTWWWNDGEMMEHDGKMLENDDEAMNCVLNIFQPGEEKMPRGLGLSVPFRPVLDGHKIDEAAIAELICKELNLKPERNWSHTHIVKYIAFICCEYCVYIYQPMKLLCFTVPKMSERCRENLGAGWNHECFQWSIAGNPSAGTVVPLWMGQRNPAPPKGWCFNPINNGMCTIYQLMIGISQRSKVSRLTVGFLVYIYIYMSIQFDVFFFDCNL